MTLSFKSRWTRLGHLPTKVETSGVCRFFRYENSAGWWSSTCVQQPPVCAFWLSHSTKRRSAHPVWKSCSGESSRQIQRIQNIQKGLVTVNLCCEQDYWQWDPKDRGHPAWDSATWNRRQKAMQIDTSITESDRSRCCRGKGLKCSSNGWSINDHGQWKGPLGTAADQPHLGRGFFPQGLQSARDSSNLECLYFQHPCERKGRDSHVLTVRVARWYRLLQTLDSSRSSGRHRQEKIPKSSRSGRESQDSPEPLSSDRCRKQVWLVPA